MVKFVVQNRFCVDMEKPLLFRQKEYILPRYSVTFSIGKRH